MSKFKGFQDYIEIFKGGKQVDSSGTEHDGDSIIDKAVAKFNAAVHEPPAVTGHPKDNAPAYGWVEALKTEVQNGTKVLMAKFKDVMPEFEELVKAGRFKKRSAAFYPDGSLRHVGFLGAMPPAVKGLADIGFNEGAAATFEFYDYHQSVVARLFGKIRSYLIQEKGIEAADQIISEWEVDDLKEAANRIEAEEAVSQYSQTTEDDVKTFSEAEVEAAKQEGREAAQAEFAEQERNRKKQAAREAIAAFCARKVEDGGPLPAWIDGGLKEFMEGLDSEEVVEFSEETKVSRLDWFTGFLKKLPATVNFKEFARRDKDVPVDDNAVELARKATDFRDAEAKAGRSVNFTQAVAHVRKGN
jgi:hypothetical protein